MISASLFAVLVLKVCGLNNALTPQLVDVLIGQKTSADFLMQLDLYPATAESLQCIFQFIDIAIGV